MIETNRVDYKKELEEVIYMFSTGEDLNIIHNESNNGEIFIDEFTLNGKAYKFNNCYKTKGELELKRYEKRFSKLGLYDILKEHYGVGYKWGALTGIRPIKLAMTLGTDFEAQLKNTFGVDEQKIDIVKEILSVQEPYVQPKGQFSDLFISVPFCPTRCEYCSFISEVISKCKYIEEYISALEKEIDSALKIKKDYRCIYLGGGTPIALDEKYLKRLLTALLPLSKNNVEFTVEAGRPDVMTKEKLQILKDYGVNRICVNPQTFSNETLKKIGRKHTAEDVYKAYEIAKEFGFSVNMDVIAGLEGESFSDFKNTIDKIIKLDPDNFTVHTLCLKKGSKLKEKLKRLTSSEISLMLNYTQNIATENGYRPYYLYRQKYAIDNLENVGYSKAGKECVYNIGVMSELFDNVACGANSVSKAVFINEEKIERYGSPKDVLTYIKKIDEIICKKEQLFKKNI